MDDLGEGDPSPVCGFHPGEVVVGVCALCLKEKLLVLAARQGRRLPLRRDARRGAFSPAPRSKKPSVAIPRVFALGSSLLHRLDSRHGQVSGGDSDDSSMESLDAVMALVGNLLYYKIIERFISIKFEVDGQVSWDKKGPSVDASSSVASCGGSSPGAAEAAGDQTLVEHAKRRQGTMWWRKRIGHLLRLPRWKRTSRASVCHVGLAGNPVCTSGRRAINLARTRATE